MASATRARAVATVAGVLAVPAAAVVLYAAAFASVVPKWDGWSWIAHLAHRTRAARLLFVVQNEHPYGLPTFVFLRLGALDRYRFDLPALVAAATVVANAALLAAVAWRAGVRSVASLLALACVACSLRQAENLLLGFQLGFPLTVTFGMLAVLGSVGVSEPGRAARRAVCAAGALVALGAGTLCSASAMVAYPAALLPLLARRDRLARATLAGVVALGLVAARVFLRRGTVAVGWLEVPAGFAVLCGSVLFEPPAVSSVAGAFVLAAFLLLAPGAWRAGGARRALAGVGVFSLGALATVAYGRGLMGGINPGRYATFGVPLAVATIALVLDAVQAARPLVRGVVCAVVLVAVAASVVGATSDALDAAIASQAEDARMIDTIMDHPWRSTREMRELLPPAPKVVRKLIEFLDVHSWNVFGRRSAYPTWRRMEIHEWQPGGGASCTARPDGSFVLRGRGYVFQRLRCPPAGECTARVEARVLAAGPGTFGLIFRDRAGAELLNWPVHVDGLSDRRVYHMASGPEGSASVDGYMYLDDERAEIDFRDFTLAVRRPPAHPGRCDRLLCVGAGLLLR